MKKYLILIVCICAIVLPSISCTQAAQPTKTTPTATKPVEPLVVKPEIKWITGEAQWAPSSEGTLASMDNDALAGIGVLSYSWSVEKGTIKGEGKKVTWVTPDTVGDYKVTVTATNSHGDQSSFSRTFSVVQNPYGKITQDTTIYLKLAIPSNQVVEESSRILAMTIADIQCTVPDADPKELTYTWTTTGGKLMGDNIEEGKTDRVGWLAPGDQGPFTVKVTVSDKYGRSATGQVNFDVYLMN
ncbi:MAG: hypothetical protein ABSA18_11675 [Dehalococcoidia bacterium]|jgi:hypothetical protein